MSDIEIVPTRGRLMARPVYTLARSESPLTNDFVFSPSITSVHRTQLIIYVSFVKGESERLEMITEFSPDEKKWFRDSSISVATGEAHIFPITYKYTDEGNYRTAIPLCDVNLMIGVRAEGDPTGSSCSIGVYMR